MLYIQTAYNAGIIDTDFTYSYNHCYALLLFQYKRLQLIECCLQLNPSRLQYFGSLDSKKQLTKKNEPQRNWLNYCHGATQETK